MPVTK